MAGARSVRVAAGHGGCGHGGCGGRGCGGRGCGGRGCGGCRGCGHGGAEEVAEVAVAAAVFGLQVFGSASRDLNTCDRLSQVSFADTSAIARRRPLSSSLAWLPCRPRASLGWSSVPASLPTWGQVARSHAAARLRLQTCQQRDRHPVTPGVPRGQQYPEYGRYTALSSGRFKNFGGIRRAN